MIDLPYLGLDEIKNDLKGFGKGLFAELLGTAVLVILKRENPTSYMESGDISVHICAPTAM